jgi:hypothetical protein
MAYIGKGPEQVLSGVASKSTFTGDGSTTTFDISTDIPAGGENDIQVFVDNVRQEPGSGASYTVGVDGSGNLRRITFNVAPEASQSIYVINPRRIEAVGAIPDNIVSTAKLQDTSVTTAKIEADAITEAKIADDAISEEHLDVTAITGNTQLSANAASDDVLLIYDSSNGTLKKINAGNVGLQQPTISSISPSNLLSGDGTGNYTITITGTGFLADATAKLTTDGGTDISFDSVTRNSSTQLTCVVAKNTANLTNANEPFDVTVTTAGALTTTSADAVTIDASPVFVTNTGSLGNVLEETAGSFSVNATDPESGAAVTFELQSGSLPPGFSITNTAADGGTAIISGTAPAVVANTTYNFTLRAVDSASNVSSRAFSITVENNPVSESFTSSGTFSVPVGITAIDVLVVAGGGAGVSIGPNPNHGYGTAGGGAGGLIFMPEYPVQACGTITVTVGLGDGPAPLGGVGPEGPGNTGQDSVFGAPGDPGFSPTSSVLTAKGGGRGAYGLASGYPPGSYQDGFPGGSGGGANGPVAGTATQPTQPGNSGAYGFGNSGSVGTKGQPGSGGGGGGAGASAPGKPGGIGRAYTIADGTTPVYYAGGGAGGPDGTGGQGGGGDAGGPVPGPRCGAANRGGGGAGDSAFCQGAAVGGKGIVIVRY